MTDKTVEFRFDKGNVIIRGTEEGLSHIQNLIEYAIENETAEASLLSDNGVGYVRVYSKG